MGYGFRYVLGAVVLIAVLFAGLSLLPTAINQWLVPAGTSQSKTAASAPNPADQAQQGAYKLPVPAPPQPPTKRTPGGVSNPPRKPGPTASSSGHAQPAGPAGGAPGGGGPGNTPGAGSGGIIGSLPGGATGGGNAGAPASRPPVTGGPASSAPAPQWFKLGGAQPDDGQALNAIGWRQARFSLILHKEPAGEPFRAATKSKAPLTIVKGSRLWAIRQEGEWILVRSPGRTIGWVNAGDLEPMSSTLQMLYGG